MLFIILGRKSKSMNLQENKVSLHIGFPNIDCSFTANANQNPRKLCSEIGKSEISMGKAEVKIQLFRP